MEIFLDFCSSGHISEAEILKMRALEGQHVLPMHVVSRVLLRMNRRFYDGDQSYLKNLFQCVPEDALPDHFVRLAILAWLDARLRTPGPIGSRGFHRTEQLVSDLVSIGHDGVRVQNELRYLLKERCVIAEHLRTDMIAMEDLVCLAPAGEVHLSLISSIDYLAACAEDLWYDDESLARGVSDRIGGLKGHFSSLTVAANARDLLSYLRRRRGANAARSAEFLEGVVALPGERLEEAEALVNRQWQAVSQHDRKIFVANIPYAATDEELERVLVGRGVLPVQVRIVRDASGQGKGYAFLTFPDVEDAMTALGALQRVNMDGRRLRVEIADGDSFDAPRRSSSLTGAP